MSGLKDRPAAITIMKIRHPLIIKWIGLLGAWVIRLYTATLCLRIRRVGPDVDPRHGRFQARCIFALWHEGLLLPCSPFGNRKLACLISQHADGEIIARICRHAGFSVIRGSSTRGGTGALRQMLRASTTHHFVVLPDGPRGPRRQFEMGVIFLASRTGMPLVLAGIGYDRPWRLRTWDRFAVPRPWSRAVVLFGDPVYVPGDATRTVMEEFRLRAEETLNALTAQAERLAEGARFGYPGKSAG